MLVMIPTASEANYFQDKEKVYLYGGKWNPFEFAYEFKQIDIEAYINVLDGQWRLVG